MKNIRRTILIGLMVGVIFFGWILYEFYSQNWNFNLFSFQDWAYIWNEFISGWIISAKSDWIFVLSLICAVPVFFFLWRMFCHVSWGKLFSFIVRQIKWLGRVNKPEQIIKKKIKVKASQSHKKVRPRPLNTTGRPLPKLAGKTMDADSDVSIVSESDGKTDVVQSMDKKEGGRPAFLDEDISNISLDEIKLPERVRLEEDLVAILSDSNYQIIKDVVFGELSFSYVGVSASQIVLCMTDDKKGDWLADEEFFNDEEPLWFSETDHRISPVYQLVKAAETFGKKVTECGFEQKVIPILIEKEGTIINAEDMGDTWRKSGVIVCRTDLGGPDELPAFATALPKATDRGTIRDLESIQGLF